MGDRAKYNGMKSAHRSQRGDADLGLTKREYYAGLALQGILANRTYDPPRRNKLDKMAIDAVVAADALLEALEN